ncbi:MAG: hypothetical protein ACJ8FY_07395 [Gemmataceae bacterium]
MLLIIALYAIPIVATVRAITDLDIWWHLRVGQWIVENQAVPTTDHFALPTAHSPWIAYSWLFEVLVYWLYQHFGLLGLVAYRVILSLAIMASLHRLIAKREPRLLLGCLLAGAAVSAFMQSLNERPWLFTILFTIWTLDAILDLRSGIITKRVWLLPLAYIVWANLHIQFVYGFLLLGAACISPAIDRTRYDRFARDAICPLGGPEWRRLIVLTTLCVLATLINPYHFRLYGVVYEYATQPGPYRLVVELTAMDFREIWDWLVLGLTGLAVFSLGRRRGLSVFEILILAGSAYLSFHTRRDSWLVAIVSAAILASRNKESPAAVAQFSITWKRAVGLAGGLACILALTFLTKQITEANLHNEVAKRFPVGAAQFVKHRKLAGPLYNHFNWGGYLIEALPDLAVAIDGRTNLHGDERIARFERTWNGLPGWQADPDLAAAGVIIADCSTPLANLLRDDDRFQLEYADEVACVFVKK